MSGRGGRGCLHAYVLAHDPLGQVNLFWREPVVKGHGRDHVANLNGGDTGEKSKKIMVRLDVYSAHTGAYTYTLTARIHFVGSLSNIRTRAQHERAVPLSARTLLLEQLHTVLFGKPF